MQCVGTTGLTRSALLRGGAVGGLGLLLAGVPAARAALPAPAPVGDDIGFLQFLVLAERTGLAFARTARTSPGLWTKKEKLRLEAVADDKAKHVATLTATLGEDAPAPGDFIVELPESAFKTRAGTLALGDRIQKLTVGVLVTGVAYTQDSSTRLLLGRLLSQESQIQALYARLGGRAVPAGLPDPLDLDTAGEQLGDLLSATGYPDD